MEVDVNGLAEVLAVRIDPSLIEKGEREMIEDLLPAAFNAAQAKAKQMHAEAMQSLAGGLPIAGLARRPVANLAAATQRGATSRSVDCHASTRQSTDVVPIAYQPRPTLAVRSHVAIASTAICCFAQSQRNPPRIFAVPFSKLD